MRRKIKQILTLLFVIGIIESFIPVSTNNVYAATSVEALKGEFPSGSTWNSNYKNKAWQCHGFACMIADRLTDTDPYNWSKTSDLNSVKPGDIIRFNRPHSILVTAVSGDTITYVDCNWVATNTVRWEQQISRGSLTSKFGSLSAVWCSPVNISSGEPVITPTPTPIDTAAITNVSIGSVSANHITVNFSCSAETKFARVVVISTTTEESKTTDFDSNLGNVSYTFNTSSMSNPGKTFQILIYGYLSSAGNGETLHRVTYNADPGFVTLPENPVKSYVEVEPEILVTNDHIIGWATGPADNPITQVVCYVNNIAYNCTLGKRDDVASEFPDYQATNHGFSFVISPLYYTNGTANIRLVAIQQSGAQTEIYNKSIKSVKLDEALFDWAWYYANHYLKDDNVAEIGVDAQALKQYYYDYGIEKGHSPNICFDPVWYVEKNKDLAEEYGTGRKAYEHYIKYLFGNDERRPTSCFLDLELYEAYNTDIANVDYNAEQLTKHYFYHGSRAETRNASDYIQEEAFSRLYNAQNYANLNTDLLNNLGNGTTYESATQLWNHFWIYVVAGNEERKTNNSFDFKLYKNYYGFSNNYEAFWYYLNTGYTENQVTIDTTAPVISDVKVTDINPQGYTVTCIIEDLTAITNVKFPTWTVQNNQDDLLSDWITNDIYSGSKNGNTYTYQVKISDHNDEKGVYVTHIYAYDSFGNFGKKEVKVVVPIDVESIKLDSSELNFTQIGEKKNLTVAITPSDATDQTVVWTTSDKSVATVENGVVTAVGNGTATITAATSDGSNLSASCQVTVLNNVHTQVASGYSGYTTWVLTDDHVLTFSGEGAMKNYASKSAMPWYNYMDQIESIVIEDGVTSIGEYAFYGMPNLTSITIPESVVSIGAYAFKGSTALDGVILPSKLTQLGESAFYGCTSLTAIDIPASLYTVRPYTFKNCTSLENVTLHEGNLQKLSDACFYGTALKEVTIPDCVTIVDGYCFKNCSQLASVKISANVKQVREAVFYGTAIPTIEIPEGVTKIGPYAFKNCTNLTSISLPATLTSVDEASFYACTALEELVLPDAVTTIGNYAFRKCEKLTSVTFSDSLQTIGESSFYGCSGLTSLNIPEGVTEIKGYAFKGCTAVTEVSLPGTLVTLGESALYGCTSLGTIVIPENMATVGDYAFSRCSGLYKVQFTGNAPSIGSGAFSKVKATVTYPADKTGWTADVMQNYGGTLTWKVN